MQPTILVTGGAGFIGSNFVLDWLQHERDRIIDLDALTYAGSRDNLRGIAADSRHELVVGNICDGQLLAELFRRHAPRAVVHFAAESHVDRSIAGPGEFVQTNVVGTLRLLQAARAYWNELSAEDKKYFRFLHISTDEVYGSLGPNDPPFTESSAYNPSSPYAASKAASDHLVRSFHRTYGLPAIITNSSNNFGPRQYPEKLIPLMLVNALEGRPLPIYGNGLNRRDWLYVSDNCAAIRLVLVRGTPGETYNIASGAEKSNLEIVRTLLETLQQLRPMPAGHYDSLIARVADRPGHDFRYALDIGKINALGWTPKYAFHEALQETVRWYLDNKHHV